MMSTHYGYKVLTDDRKSFIFNRQHCTTPLSRSLHRAAISYPKNRWVKPRLFHGPLCIFSDLKSARDFARPRAKCIIVQCEYEKSRSKKIWSLLFNNKKKRNIRRQLPRGTILCKRVKCLE